MDFIKSNLEYSLSFVFEFSIINTAMTTVHVENANALVHAH